MIDQTVSHYKILEHPGGGGGNNALLALTKKEHSNLKVSDNLGREVA